jgi:hypothetical protein
MTSACAASPRSDTDAPQPATEDDCCRHSRQLGYVKPATPAGAIPAADGAASDVKLGASRRQPHSTNQPASTVCTPNTWMMPSTVGSAFVFNWMNVSVPLVDQLIWPAAVNGAVSMKVKA